MLLTHWTEEEVQRYLDGGTSPTDAARVRHLRTCSTCRATLARYRMLYRLLKAEPAIHIPAHFARTTALKIAKRNALIDFGMREPMWISAGLLFVLGIWFRVYSPPSIPATLKGLFQVAMELKILLSPSLKSWIGHAGKSMPLILLGGGVLVAAALLDRYFLEPRLRRLQT